MELTEPLSDLAALDPSLLYVFVAGPGEGEGLAVHLPGPAWLIVDGCTAASGGSPLAWILERYRPARTPAGMVLTHPHEDHCKGFAALLDQLEPDFVAVTGGTEPRKNLVNLLDALWSSHDADATSDVMRSRAVRAAIKRIRVWDDDHPGSLVSLHDGEQLPALSPHVIGYVRAPETLLVDAFLEAADLERRVKAYANELSAVIELVFGGSTIVLTGDLPRYRTGTDTVIPTGWDNVLIKHAHLGTHLALKLPHHGSAAAFHPDLMTPVGDLERLWCVTPYNSSRLPQLAKMDGLPRILARTESVHLTALPASIALQAASPNPGVVPISNVVNRLTLLPTGEPFLDEGVEIRPGSAIGPADPIWAAAIDEAGQIVARWRGASALEVVR